MKIKKLHIQNFKSLVDFQLEDMPQFCAFVGPNASGKSNIFEALEFLNFILLFGHDASSFFAPKTSLVSYTSHLNNIDYKISFLNGIDIVYGFKFITRDDSALYTYTSSTYGSPSVSGFKSKNDRGDNVIIWKESGILYNDEFEIFIDNFSRIFVGKDNLKKINQPNSDKLLIDASNTAQILGQVFQDDVKREDFIEWLRILIPEFENIEVKKNEFDGSFHIFVKEKTHDKHFPVTLLSDGTKNILALMAAVYQSNQPQFLCIEEPENGLHPHAIELLVDFFREKCETEGHHIWLNTHSPTLVRCLAIDEVITVNKINGETKARQFKKEEAVNMKMDEAWLTNALGGGVSWSK